MPPAHYRVGTHHLEQAAEDRGDPVVPVDRGVDLGPGHLPVEGLRGRPLKRQGACAVVPVPVAVPTRCRRSVDHVMGKGDVHKHRVLLGPGCEVAGDTQVTAEGFPVAIHLLDRTVGAVRGLGRAGGEGVVVLGGHVCVRPFTSSGGDGSHVLRPPLSSVLSRRGAVAVEEKRTARTVTAHRPRGSATRGAHRRQGVSTRGARTAACSAGIESSLRTRRPSCGLGPAVTVQQIARPKAHSPTGRALTATRERRSCRMLATSAADHKGVRQHVRTRQAAARVPPHIRE